MSNPQQPELAGSRKTPSQDQDAVSAVVESQPQPSTKGPSGPVPPDNQPGHHPAQEQDKPDAKAFAERLGVPDEAGNPPGDSPVVPPNDDTALPGIGVSKQVATVAAGVVALLVALLAVKLFRRRGRKR